MDDLTEKYCERCRKMKPIAEFRFKLIGNTSERTKYCTKCNEKSLESNAIKGMRSSFNESCGKIGAAEYRSRAENGMTCKDNCYKYKNKFYPCSRYPELEETTYCKIELALTCIEFKDKNKLKI